MNLDFDNVVRVAPGTTYTSGTDIAGTTGLTVNDQGPRAINITISVDTAVQFFVRINSVNQVFNGGGNLGVNTLYTFSFTANKQDVFSFRLSGNCNIQYFQVCQSTSLEQAAQGGGSSSGGGGSGTTGTFDSGATDETKTATLVRAATTGQDLAAAANAKNVPISADLASNFSTAARAGSAVEALYVNALLGGTSIAGNVYGAQVAIALAAQAYTTQRIMSDSVVRGDDGATYSAIGVRGSSANQATSIMRMLTDSSLRAVDSVAGGYSVILGSPETLNSGTNQLVVAEGRKSAFYSSRLGRRYVCKSPNLTGVAAATSFVATTPTFLIVAGSTKAVIIRRIKVNLPVVGTSTTFRLLVKTDTANRFSAGGTARAPATLNGGNIVATGLAQNLEAPTATAEGGGTRDIDCDSNQLVAGSECVYEPEDGLIIPANGSLLVYVITATAAATVDYTIEFEEAQVQ